jgi:hypothetical protein
MMSEARGIGRRACIRLWAAWAASDEPAAGTLPDMDGRAEDRLDVAGEMLEEARRIVEAARSHSLQARLVGGLAVRSLCRGAPLCDRPARDIDLVAPHEQLKALLTVFADLGYAENTYVRLASGGHATQFFRECRHERDGRRAHVDDRVDLYLDDFRLHHRVPLRERLGLTDFSVPAGDVLLVKLQRSSPDDDDLRDMLALLSGLRTGDDDEPETIDAGYVARTCARDWGLHHDVARNLERCRLNLDRSGLPPAEAARARDTIARLETALERAAKSLRWRLRSVMGEALPWSDVVDDRDGQHIAVRERVATHRGDGA